MGMVRRGTGHRRDDRRQASGCCKVERNVCLLLNMVRHGRAKRIYGGRIRSLYCKAYRKKNFLDDTGWLSSTEITVKNLKTAN